MKLGTPCRHDDVLLRDQRVRRGSSARHGPSERHLHHAGREQVGERPDPGQFRNSVAGRADAQRDPGVTPAATASASWPASGVSKSSPSAWALALSVPERIFAEHRLAQRLRRGPDEEHQGDRDLRRDQEVGKQFLVEDDALFHGEARCEIK